MFDKARLRIRFDLNQKTGAATNAKVMQRANSQFASYIINDVGLRMADKRYRALVKEIRGEITYDVHQEIANIAKLYTRMAIGRAGLRNRDFTLQAKTTGESNFGKFGTWAPLSPATIARKGHGNFFKDTGALGLAMGIPGVWEQAFGPVKVTVTRTKLAEGETIPKAFRYKDQGGEGTHFAVAQIKVAAMGRITSEMLPELLSGRLGGDNHNGRETGLLNLFDSVNPSLKFKLGNWSKSGKGSYRPSLEPFLAFALTRAIPAAIQRRIERKNRDYSR